MVSVRAGKTCRALSQLLIHTVQRTEARSQVPTLCQMLTVKHELWAVLNPHTSSTKFGGASGLE